MRIKRSLIVMVLGLVASAASAQQTPNTPPPEPGQNTGLSTLSTLGSPGQIDFGLRGTVYGDNSDEARYQRFQDVRNGPFLDGFRYGNSNDHRLFDVRAEHVGYRDQRYGANYNNYGRVKASFEWNQIPLFFSQDTATLYSSPSAGTFLISDAIQSGIQSGSTTLLRSIGQASPFDLQLKRNIADFRLTYTATKTLDLNLSFKNTHKTGEQPWAGTFGFSDAVELAAPVDTRTTEFGAAAEWTNNTGEIRIGYDGSFFRNGVGTLLWDNPLRVTDSPTAGPVQGRESLWPNSDLNAGSISGLLKLPARSQATAYVSVGNWSQNAALVPFTTNTALPVFQLDRPTADAQARVTATAFAFNSRPTTTLWLNARFRSYDFDNRTPVFHVTNTVAYDTSVAAFAEGGTSPFSFSRKIFDLDASFTPITFAAFRAGYSREMVDQTFRVFDTTTENTVRLSADATGINWLTLRAVYEHAKRVGTGFDEQTLDDIGEQVSLRQFDISDRSSDRFSSILIVTPLSQLSLNGTAFVGREDRSGAVFGLRSNNNNGVAVGFDYVPNNAVSAGMSYEYEKYTALQASRQANPGAQFTDPTRDWTTDGADRAHTLNASVDLLKLWPKTDVRFAYDYSRAESVYVYGLAPNTTLSRVVQLPAVLNKRNRATADARYYLTRHVAVGLVYWYEKYDVDDYAFNPATLNTIAQPSFLMLGYLYRPYTANTVWGRVTYLW
jgi:MtrB/PioB family decaheme-associated outer membrane protein